MLLLHMVRGAVLNNEYSTRSEQLGFLHRPFKPQFYWWEIVCVAQKLVLVGFLVLNPFNPGSFTKLILGLFVALLFAVLQMQVQPYRGRNDNFLATVSNVSLVMFFVSSVLYRMIELTSEFDAVADQLTCDWASRSFTVSFTFISVVMIASLFGCLVLMIVLHLIELFVGMNEQIFRWALDGSVVKPPTLQAEQFHTFLSVSDRVARRVALTKARSCAPA